MMINSSFHKIQVADTNFAIFQFSTAVFLICMKQACYSPAAPFKFSIEPASRERILVTSH